MARKASELKFDNEAVGLIVLGLALEAHEFALARGIPSHSIDDKLPLVFGVLDGHLSHLLDVRDVPARDTSCLAALSIGFSDEGYRLLAAAAKDRVANAIDRD
ncbi:MAG: hypothetical protein WCY15_12855 [Phenylobacterium sp.]|uniref:hypothetical protein n=1 Tax=Phenylobacterium sp. TaxID=1871053 RepID=UPI0035686C98